MDPSILELFTAEEILKRLTKKASNGALHVFTSKEAANLFFQDGTIVAAAKGLVEGEEVLRQLLEWKEARFLWQPEQRPPPSLKPLDLHFPEFIAKSKLAPKLEIGGKTLSEKSGSYETAPVFISIPTRASSTGPLQMTRTLDTTLTPPPPPPTIQVKNSDLIPVVNVLTATKNINPSPRGADTLEDALMRKHQLALVSVSENPGQRLRIIRSSNLVGRNPACDFTMNHSSISRQHCLLQITERGLHVKDLSTTNGTKVNGINLTEGYVSVGDKLTIGHLEFLVENDEPDA